MDYTIEKKIILMFNYETEKHKIEKTLGIKTYIDDEVEITETDLELLLNAGLISEKQYSEIIEEDEVTAFILTFE